MANGAGRLFKVFQQTSEATNNNSNQLITLTVKSINPLILAQGEKLQITEDFIVYNNNVDYKNFQIGDVLTAFVFNNGQTYFIEQNNTNYIDIKEELDEINDEIDKLYGQVSNNTSDIEDLQQQAENFITKDVHNLTNYYDKSEINNFINYSSTPIKVGKDPNGNDIYRVEVNTGRLPDNSSKLIDFGFDTNTMQVRKLQGMAYHTNGTSITLPFVTDVAYANVGLNINSSGYLVINSNSYDRSNYTESFVDVEYIIKELNNGTNTAN